MGIYALRSEDEKAFIGEEEVFPNTHLAQIKGEYGVVVGCRVLVTFDKHLTSELHDFYSSVRKNAGIDTTVEGPGPTVKAYESWLSDLQQAPPTKPTPTDRSEFMSILSASHPPPPPGRRNVVPKIPPFPPPLPQVYGHLPFSTRTLPHEHFYRFEPWPTSKKLTLNPGKIGAKTYASPASELPFLPTGFAAVARNALPSLFPAVFRYELQPVANSQIDCGAIVPYYGQSGGGVEVFFPNAVPNNGPIANPVVIPPL